MGSFLTVADLQHSQWQAITHVYLEDEPGRRSVAKLLTKRRGAANCSQYRQAAGVGAEAVVIDWTYRDTQNRESTSSEHN
jgi:hypothetical protein